MEHFEDTHGRDHESALAVNRGVDQPPVVNPYYQRRKRHRLSTDDYMEGILSGNITILSQAITLVESLLPEHYAQAQEIIERCLPYSGRSIRIGITGVPGAGKSTFIESIGDMVANQGHKLTVLAIDPSSERSKGSILGDKTRMETLVHNPHVFIRPSPSAGSLGGVARKTRESIILCEAAGFDIIFIETVGVGQSETAVHSMVDMFLLLQIAGAGDELQGIKRGIMEMADMIAINKADSGNQQRAEIAKSHFANALNLFPMPDSGWRPRVYTCSAVSKNGLLEIWNGIEDFLKFTQKNGYYQRNRHRQAKYWMYETIHEVLRDQFYRCEAVEQQMDAYEQMVLSDRKSSFVAAKELLQLYFDSIRQ
ncbi:MAG: methylmalonyl Co-A mutase-associated GTPase MeaB [Alistipes sp.]|nr:methylmalonyl Co-A mutase-associated GTPase MeaB [Alistipes sp.]